jgi:hypothetical protein
MAFSQMQRRLVLLICSGILFLGGCGPEKGEPTPVFEGEKTLAEVLSILKTRTQSSRPMKANGQCLWQSYSEGKATKESFSVRIWANPPGEIYMQGDIAFNPRGIVLGSNASEFWLLIKPEASSYSWGLWSEQSAAGGLMLVPKSLDEALGIIEIADNKNWSMSKEGDIGVLVKRNDKGGIVKKLYINRRDYLVRKIEYFDVEGKATAFVELDKYRGVSKGFFVPVSIRIIIRGDEKGEGSASITLNLTSVKPESFTEKRRKIFFNRPKTKGYKHIYKIIDGSMVEQPG